MEEADRTHAMDLAALRQAAELEAAGGYATVIVRFADGHEAQLDLSQLTA